MERVRRGPRALLTLGVLVVAAFAAVPFSGLASGATAKARPVVAPRIAVGSYASKPYATALRGTGQPIVPAGLTSPLRPASSVLPPATASLSSLATTGLADGLRDGSLEFRDDGLLDLHLSGDRVAQLRIPMDADTTPHRLLVVLPGWRMTSAAMEAATGFDAVADRGDAIVAYGSGEQLSWNAGVCCGYASASGIDDVSYVVELIRTVETLFPVQDDDVVVSGFSNGGMLALRVACERPDVVHAGASVSGTLLVACPHPARLLHIQGVRDTIVPFLGGHSNYTGANFPSTMREGQKLLPRSKYALVTWRGGHSWPTAATGLDASGLVLRMF